MIQEIVALIDRSGSMMGKEEDTIGGINTTIKELQNNKEKDTIINMSIKFFDHESYLKFRHLNINNVRPLKITDLCPRGQTALLDAMGTTINYFLNKKKNNLNCFDSCIIYVATDGLENSSKIFNNDLIKELLYEAKKYNIEILYLGANQDAIFEAAKFGLNSEQAMNYTENKNNINEAYRSLASATKRSRNGSNLSFLQSERNHSLI
jgi:uncharacterized protein YegL